MSEANLFLGTREPNIKTNGSGKNCDYMLKCIGDEEIKEAFNLAGIDAQIDYIYENQRKSM